MFWSLASSWVVLPSSQRSMAASACSHALSSAALRAAALGLEACIRTSLACPTRQIEWLKAMRGCAHWKLLKGLPHGSASTALSEWSKPMRSASITSMPLPRVCVRSPGAVLEDSPVSDWEKLLPVAEAECRAVAWRALAG